MLSCLKRAVLTCIAYERPHELVMHTMTGRTSGGHPYYCAATLALNARFRKTKKTSANVTSAKRVDTRLFPSNPPIPPSFASYALPVDLHSPAIAFN